MNRILILYAALSLFATKAKCDKIIFKGDTLTTTEKSFLESYPGIKSLKPKMVSYQSACYNAEFTILNDELYLTNIYGCDGDVNKKEDINALFNVIDGKVKADWVKGTLWMPIGKPIRIHGHTLRSAGMPLYMGETRISIAKGKITESKQFNYANSHRSIYQPLVDPNGGNALLSKFLYQHVNWSKIPDLKNKTVQVAFDYQSGTSGKLENIKKLKGMSSPGVYYEPGDPNDMTENPLYLNEATRVVNLIPWSVYYRHGEVFNEKNQVSVYFNEETRKIGTSK